MALPHGVPECCVSEDPDAVLRRRSKATESRGGRLASTGSVGYTSVQKSCSDLVGWQVSTKYRTREQDTQERREKNFIMRYKTGKFA